MKIFDDWNLQKKRLHKDKLPEFYINPREIWYTKMGQNIGFEQNGKQDFKRPVLVIKKLGSLFLTIAMTSKGKDNARYYHKLETANFTHRHKAHSNSSYQ